MSEFSGIPDIQNSSVELLEVAGFFDGESLAQARADELSQELQRANRILKIAKNTPSEQSIAAWITRARELTGFTGPPDDVVDPGGDSPAVGSPVEATSATATPIRSGIPVDHERNRQVAALLAKAPCAIPLPAVLLVKNKLAVADIPPAILLNRYAGDLDIRVDERVPDLMPGPKPKSSFAVGYVQVADPSPPRLEIDTSRLKTTEDLVNSPRRTASVPSPTAPATHPPEEDRVALIRAPRESTNRGVNPDSRRYIRGVLHSHPHSLAFGAFITLILMFVVPVAIVSGVLLLLSDQLPEKFGWVPTWLLAFPMAMPLLGLAYLIWGVGGSCRICGQRLFIRRACLKNTKAHHVPGLGYIIPVCFHMLLFRWFRCTFCGTPVRLKK
jgi:hypothetical protein